MTFILKYLSAFFKQPKDYFFFKLSAREKKKIIFKAVKESNKMQQTLLEKYRREFPHDTQQFYTN